MTYAIIGKNEKFKEKVLVCMCSGKETAQRLVESFNENPIKAETYGCKNFKDFEYKEQENIF